MSAGTQQHNFQTPIVFIGFNRPEQTRRVFEAIAKVKPRQLLLVADGPRSNKPNEDEVCRQVRQIMTAVDWPCEVSKNFAECNLGCQERVVSGLDWAFSLVDEAVILEDDCLPDPSFFPFCRELLQKYRNDQRVFYIAGTNLVCDFANVKESYYFSEYGAIWGWATWKTRWMLYDRHLESWPKLRDTHLLSEVFDDSEVVLHWTRVFDQMHEKRGPNTWDYQWFFTGLKNHSVVVMPSTNLVTNIGLDGDATHTSTFDARLKPAVVPMNFPLQHPSSLIPLRSVDRRLQAFHSPSYLNRMRGKLGRAVRGFRAPVG